jgi:hypothetical protein
MAGPITGDLVFRQYLGISTRADVLNGFPPMGGLQTEAVSFGNPSTLTIPSTACGQTFYFDSAAGIVYTLPAPASMPIGGFFDFVTTVTITSNSAKILTDAATTFLLGGIASINATASALYAANGTTIRSVNGNGTTTGGIAGSRYRVTLLNATQWALSGVTFSSGTVATPLATS